jgi:hypothetical protein
MLKATVRVNNFLPEVGNVLGIQGDFDLQIDAPINDSIMQGPMSLVGRPGAGIVVRLTKKADL